jgi:hypothetical protein
MCQYCERPPLRRNRPLGSTNRTADSALITELSRHVGVEGFDEEPIPDIDSEAVDFVAYVVVTSAVVVTRARPSRRMRLRRSG